MQLVQFVIFLFTFNVLYAGKSAAGSNCTFSVYYSVYWTFALVLLGPYSAYCLQFSVLTALNALNVVQLIPLVLISMHSLFCKQKKL